MLTKTIGQLSAAASITSDDKLEIEQSGASKYGTVVQVGAALASNSTTISNFASALAATSAETVAGSASSVFVSPATLRAGLNAENAAPMYACRAFGSFDGTTTSSSITATYTRASGSTTVVVTATGHNCITGNIQYLDFTSGTASDNTYIVTVTGPDSFEVIGTGSAATSGNVSIKRCPLLSSGNVNNVSRSGTGLYWANFAIAMPSANYVPCLSNDERGVVVDDANQASNYSGIITYNYSAAATDYKVYCAFFA